MTYVKKNPRDVYVGDWIRRDGKTFRVTKIGGPQPHYYGGTTVMAYHLYTEVERRGIFGRVFYRPGPLFSHVWDTGEVEVLEV